MDARSADAIVVGAGHNGLTAAAYLAKAGLDVVVCERREVVGGAAVTEEIAPGFRASTASYALSLFRPDVYADLELARHGLEVVAKDPQMFIPVADGRSFFVWRDVDRTCEELARIHAPDADGYRRWCAFWDEAAPKLRMLVDDPSPLDAQSFLGPQLYGACVASSAAELVESFFQAPEVQGAFAAQGIIGTNQSVRDPGTAWVMSYHALGGDVYGSSGTWGYVRGGMGALSWSLFLAASVAGAEIRREAPVVEILTERNRASGVRLDDGTVIRAPTVLSGVDPKTTFLRLVPHMDPDFVRSVEEWKSPGCVIKVNLALSELPEFTCRPGEGPQHRGTIEISPSIDYLHAAYAGGPPFMEGFVQSAVDTSLVDGDGHVLSLFAQYATDGDPTTVIDTFATYAPNVRDAIVGCDALGPKELEERFGLWGGNIFHGEITLDQCFDKRFDYRTPIAGLYLCGSGARPGGGVMGAAGRNAARAVLSDLGR